MRTLALLALLMPTAAYSAECTEVVPVTEPCSGLLMPLSVAKDGIKCHEVDVPNLVVGIEHQKQLFTARNLALQAQLAAASTTVEKLDRIALKAIEIKPAKPWWESGEFIYGVGVATGVGAVVLGAWTANQVK